MTVCIAAICRDRYSIVAVSDSKVSFGDYSADDVLVKSVPVAPNWRVLFSGNNITDVDWILQDARRCLSKVSVHDPETVGSAIQDAYFRRLHSQIEAKVLMQYGLKLAEFRDRGKQIFTETVYEQVHAKVAAVSLSCQFMVVGFTDDQFGHILLVDGEGSPQSYDSVGFCAIGSGSNAAYGTLLYHADRNSLGADCHEEDAVYCCCDAKFMSESASDVGKQTFITVFEADGPTRFIAASRVEEIRRAWEKHGAPRIPPTIRDEISEMLFTHDDWSAPGGGVASSERIFGADADRDIREKPGNERRYSRALLRSSGQDITPAKKSDPQSTKPEQSDQTP